MSLKRAVKKQYYYCRMGSECGSYLKIGLETLEKTVWGVLQKLAETYHEEEKACQSKKMQILSAVSKMKELVDELIERMLKDAVFWGILKIFNGLSDDNLKFLLDMIQCFMKPAEAGEKSLNRATEDRGSIRRIGSLEGQNLIDEDYDIDECNNEIAEMFGVMS